MVTEAPTGPELGLKLARFGGDWSTVKLIGLLAIPATVTTTFPVVAVVGTGTMMLVLLQLVGVADTPLNVTVLVPWDKPKFWPEMVTDAPAGAATGFRLVML